MTLPPVNLLFPWHNFFVNIHVFVLYVILILFRPAPHLQFCYAILIGLFDSTWYGNVTVVKVYDHAEMKTRELSHVIILHLWLREWMWTDLWRQTIKKNQGNDIWNVRVSGLCWLHHENNLHWYESQNFQVDTSDNLVHIIIFVTKWSTRLHHWTERILLYW